MSSEWKPTHLFDGVPCALLAEYPQALFPCVAIQYKEGWDSDRIPLAPWERHAKPLITVGTATLPWVSVEDVPHPTDGTRFLALRDDGDVLCHPAHSTMSSVTHWCHLP